MIEVCQANPEHVEGIAQVCIDGHWAAYSDIYTKDYIESIIRDFYSYDRVLDDVTHTSKQWGGYFIALEDDQVIGAGGGGMISDTLGELFVLYVHPDRRNEGIGTLLLRAITNQQKDMGATEQWVSVQKGNLKGIPFYEARGFQYQYEQKGWHNEQYITLRYRRYLR